MLKCGRAHLIEYCIESEKQNGCLSVLVIGPHDCLADWELQLTAAAHIMKEYPMAYH